MIDNKKRVVTVHFVTACSFLFYCQKKRGVRRSLWL